MKRSGFLLYLFVLFLPAIGFSEQSAPASHSYKALVVYLQGVDVDASKRAFQSAATEIFSVLGVRIRVEHDLFLSVPDFQGTPMRRVALMKHFLRTELHRKYDMVFVTLPKSLHKHSHGKSLLGFSEAVGSLGRKENTLAYSVVTGDELFDSRLMMHEIAHLLGAGHSEEGLMKENFDPHFVKAELSDESLCEIQEARRKRGAFPFTSAAFKSVRK